MKINKQSLDHYLTTAPHDDFTNWCEKVDEAFSKEFWEANKDWISDGNGKCNKWLNSLFDSGKDPQEAAEIIERAHSIPGEEIPPMPGTTICLACGEDCSKQIRQ